MGTLTLEYITTKIDTLQDQLDGGVQSSDLNTGQTEHKVVFDLGRIEKSLWSWKNKLKRLYPQEFLNRYGPWVSYVSTNRRC